MDYLIQLVFFEEFPLYIGRMNKLIELAESLVSSGDRYIEDHGPLQFHEVAHDLLKEGRLHEVYRYEDLVKDSFNEDFNLVQNYPSLQFSDFPVTLAMGKHCFLDLYFWRRRPTTIHNHHFTGAFQCLEGVNVDLEFEYLKSESIGAFHDLGEVKLKNSRRLVKGDIAKIDLLDKFIHQNHHQAELTINACFRTPDIGSVNLSNYLYSGLRLEQHPDLIDRVSRLMGFINIGDFDVKTLNLTTDDAIHFLIRTYKSSSRSKMFLDVRNFMKTLVTADIDALMGQHELKMQELENEYN